MTISEQEQINLMFDRIAKTYDQVNLILSFGCDRAWRRALTKRVPKNKELTILDVATGTADLIISICNDRPLIKEAVGVDVAQNMLEIGQKKINQAGLNKKVKLIKANGSSLPFRENYFDVVTIAFGIRNIVEQKKALLEIQRVLKPEGLLLILEFSVPQNIIVKYFYLAYFRHILPWLGGLISRDTDAYRYLNRTVEQFPSPEEFSLNLKNCGFVSVTNEPLTFGISTIYSARKI